MKRILLLLNLVLISTCTFAQWGSLGSGLSANVKALTVFNNQIYAGGEFTDLKYVAKWDDATNTWVMAGDGLGNVVNCLEVHAGKLYAGGTFITSGSGTSMSRIAVLNTTTNLWEAIGSGFNNAVKSMFSDGTDLYIGGIFTGSGATPVAKIGKLAGATFAQVGTDPSGTVECISKYNNQIYVGCSFSLSASHLKKLVGTVWQDVSNFNDIVYSLRPYETEFYVGGAFTTPAFRISKIIRINVGAAINRLDNTVYAMYSTTSKLFAGGAFTTAPNSTPTINLPHFLSQKGNTPFFSEGAAFNGNINAIANLNGKIVVGGAFTASGSTSLNHVSMSSNTIDINELSSIVKSKSFYPNPMSVKSSLVLETTQPIHQPTLSIYDANSRLIKTIQAESGSSVYSYKFDISRDDLASGNYFYSVQDENGKSLTSDIFLVD
ncbi:MAG: T9SS type A sorting domain-containing protein [Bacteroidetes bacterium]|nr:MAG: T9SS type A sorting domain-containing protein [Bacteroidota bacterium]